MWGPENREIVLLSTITILFDQVFLLSTAPARCPCTAARCARRQVDSVATAACVDDPPRIAADNTAPTTQFLVRVFSMPPKAKDDKNQKKKDDGPP